MSVEKMKKGEGALIGSTTTKSGIIIAKAKKEGANELDKIIEQFRKNGWNIHLKKIINMIGEVPLDGKTIKDIVNERGWHQYYGSEEAAIEYCYNNFINNDKKKELSNELLKPLEDLNKFANSFKQLRPKDVDEFKKGYMKIVQQLEPLKKLGNEKPQKLVNAIYIMLAKREDFSKFMEGKKFDITTKEGTFDAIREFLKSIKDENFQNEANAFLEINFEKNGERKPLYLLYGVLIYIRRKDNSKASLLYNKETGPYLFIKKDEQKKEQQPEKSKGQTEEKKDEEVPL